MRLAFEKGTVVVDRGGDGSASHDDGGGEGDVASLPHTTRDDRTGDGRALAMHYPEIVEYLDAEGIAYEDEVLDLVPTPELRADLDLRPYQRDALEQWETDRRGVLVLPTGAGKTYLGMAAIEEVDAPAFVVVPTLDLVDQWIEELGVFGVDVGEYTGREKRLGPITVSTYDSAYAHAERLGNRFSLLVFDEVHHLAAEGYRHVAEFFAAPYRLGLTATYEREDEKHEVLSDLLGGKVYEVETDELAGEYLAEHTVERIDVDLTPAEQERYDEHAETFREYLRASNVRMNGPADFQKVVLRSGNDPRAWEAVRARNEARKIAYGSAAKLDELATILERHRGDRIIVFTRYNDLVDAVVERFFVPPITHETPKAERRRILRKFREGEYPAIVSSRVLDEGIDVPAANVGVILSGTGSTREYRQRLGRILRPSGDVARLYEVVSAGTGEVSASFRRKR